MTDVAPSAAIGLYALFVLVFIILENRRPPSTLAWLLVLTLLPGVGLAIYVLFGRDTKAFAKEDDLLRQDLDGQARPLLLPTLSRQAAEIERLERESPSRRKLMMLVRRSSHSTLTRRNAVEILQDAHTFYPRMLDDMRRARRTIHLQYFIWRADELSERFKAVLLEKARAGVEVRLLYDPVGSFGRLSRAYVKDLKAAGAQVAPTSALWRLHTISYRNHRKITVIDGAIGYTGGMNIGQEHLSGGKSFGSWRDTQVRIQGEGAAALQAVFAVDWYNAVGEDLFASENFPAVEAAPEEGSASLQILTSGPDSQWASIRQLYFYMIVSAQRHVYLQSPYFVLDATISEALKSAALAGVDVKVMTSARSCGSPLPAWAGNTFMLEVVEAGVQVFLYEKGYLHAKTVSVDSETCSIGSANIDIRSFSINYELNAILYDKELTLQLERTFEQDLAHCRPFEADVYRDRNILFRFRDSGARLLAPLL